MFAGVILRVCTCSDVYLQDEKANYEQILDMLKKPRPLQRLTTRPLLAVPVTNLGGIAHQIFYGMFTSPLGDPDVLRWADVSSGYQAPPGTPAVDPSYISPYVPLSSLLDAHCIPLARLLQMAKVPTTLTTFRTLQVPRLCLAVSRWHFTRRALLS